MYGLAMSAHTSYTVGIMVSTSFREVLAMKELFFNP
jgi:hypothetical protein